MLSKTIRFALNNKLFILLSGVLLMVGGVFIGNRMDIDVFPDLTAPTVVLMTDAHGMAAEEVERLVTFPIEIEVNGASQVRRVRSESVMGFSFVWVEFDWGMDIFQARQVVSEKMIAISGKLPSGVTPVLAPQSSIMGEILFIGLQADSTSMMELRTLSEWVIKPAILATGGVSQVTIIGGDYKQYQILADPIKMNALGVTMEELAQVGSTMSANSSGGIVRDYGNEYALRGMARTDNLEELGATFIKSRNAYPVVVSDVADVVIGSAVKMGHASQNGSPAIILSVSKQPNINTLRVTRQIELNLAEMQKSLPADVKLDTRIFRQADFIESSVNNVGRALIEGAIFVVIILLVFLANLRTTFISVIAIPLSLMGSIIVLYALGININTMTLGGMCIAIGSLVDDAIIDVENVYKRLKQNQQKPLKEREPSIEVVFNASVEIRASILNATLIIIVAFIPLFFLSGMEGRMLKPLGIAFIVSLLMSLVVAVTITPLLCKIMLSNEQHLESRKKEQWVTQKLSVVYKKALEWSLEHSTKVLCATAALLLITLVLFSKMGQSFLPPFNEGSLTISAVCQPGISLEQSDRMGNLIETELLTIPEVTSTARRTGRGEVDEHSQATNSGEVDVNFSLGKRDSKEFMAEVREKLAQVPGVATTIGQPLGHRIDHMLSGTRANIAIKLFGSDLSQLVILANQIKSAVDPIEGLVDVTVEPQNEIPQLQIRAKRRMLARYGISIGQFNRFIEQAFAGETLSEIYEGQRSFDLVLRLNPNYTQSIEQVKSALIDTESGKKVPLEEVAEIISSGGPNSISRENVQRKIVISANISDNDLTGIVEQMKVKIDQQITLPEGYRIEYGGQFESAQRASRTLLLTSLLALGIIFLLLYGEFKDVTLSAIVLLNLPLALIGGILALYFNSGVVSIPSIIGFITLFGIATRNGILLISKYQHTPESGHEDLRQSVVSGSLDRLNPILMTALTAALALIPLVINGHKSGNEIQSPMAVVVLGGLFTSTLLNIFIIPIVYEMVQKRKIAHKKRQNKAES